ncbi:hypothetical protein [Bradyrhizobium sp. STM 3562]|uniref:hypothetical protein n=1 Tax=Bradyrhizobium sp. STM 3562 TaxID=578924 RepID=UPI00388F72C3
MQLISSRTIAGPEGEALSTSQAREALFRDDRGDFILYRGDGDAALAGEERIVRLRLREALIWLNEPDDCGSWWE